MSPKIHGLIKIYREKEYADRFLQGEMFAQRLSWFRELKGEDGRSDEYEGAAFVRKDDLILNFESQDPSTGEVSKFPTMTSDDLAGPVIMQHRAFDNVNLFCMYAFHSGGFQETEGNNIAAYKEHLRIDEKCLKLGAYAVGIKDGPEFLKRVDNAVKQRSFRHRHKLVQYYDPNVGVSIDPFSLDVAFTKREDLSYLREYRFAIYTGIAGPDPITLDIGPIHDIAFLMNTKGINRTLDIEIRPPQ